MPICRQCAKQFEGAFRRKYCSLLCQFNKNLGQVDTAGCLIWGGAFTESGYGVLNVSGKVQTAHRISYSLFIGEIPQNMMVCHRCDNKKCVNRDHLFIGTHNDNMEDMAQKGRAAWKNKRRTQEDLESMRIGRMLNPQVISNKQREIASDTMKKLWEIESFRRKMTKKGSDNPNFGRKMSSDQRAKLKSHWDNNSMSGRKHSEETKRKMRESALNRTCAQE